MEELFVSIIIVSRNREKILLETLIIGCNIIKNRASEIIVINDGDAPIEIPKDIFTQIRYFENLSHGVSAARNYGVSKAKGNILFFMDDDMWITSEAIETIIELKNKNYFNENVVIMNWEYPKQLQIGMKNKKIGRYILQSNYHTLKGRAKLEIDPEKLLISVYGIGSGSLIMTKNIFEKIGGYNEKIFFQGEDFDLAKKITQQKFGILLSTPITCFHNQKDRLDIKRFLLRVENGYRSQVAAGIIDMEAGKIKSYRLLLPFAPLCKLLYRLIPNASFFDIISFRLIGILSSLTYLKVIRSKEKH